MVSPHCLLLEQLVSDSLQEPQEYHKPPHPPPAYSQGTCHTCSPGGCKTHHCRWTVNQECRRKMQWLCPYISLLIPYSSFNFYNTLLKESVQTFLPVGKKLPLPDKVRSSPWSSRSRTQWDWFLGMRMLLLLLPRNIMFLESFSPINSVWSVIPRIFCKT